MKKTIISKLTTFVVAVMAALGIRAETATWTNVDQGFAVNKGGYGPYVLQLPATAELPAGSVVDITCITIAHPNDGDAPRQFMVIEGLGDGSAKQASHSVNATTENPILGGTTKNAVYAFDTYPRVIVGKAYMMYPRDGAAGTATGNTSRMSLVQTTDGRFSAITMTNAAYDTYRPAYKIDVEVVSKAEAPAKRNYIAINFDADGNRAIAAESCENVLATQIAGKNWNQVTGANGSASGLKVYNDADGSARVSNAALTYASANRYAYGAATRFLAGYLDDGGEHARVTVTDIPFASYDVIVFGATDSSGRMFSPVTVNEAMYTKRDGETVTTTNEGDRWGETTFLVSDWDKNAIKIENLTGNLSVTGGANADSNRRGGIAAVVIVDRGSTEVKTLSYSGSVNISTINADVGESLTVDVTLAPDTTLVCDAEPTFLNKLVTMASTGSITLQAETKPAYAAQLNLSGVKGGILRSWLTMPTNDVMGFNFNASACRNGGASTDDAANDTGLALEIGGWACDQRSQNGSSTDMFADGLSVLTWKSNNVYTENGTCSNFIQGYLDDSAGVFITLSNVPYDTYDLIIYCSTDDSSKSFTSKVVNGKIYTWDATTGATKEVSSATTWGLASAAAGKAVIGANTLRINGLMGPLSIESRNGSNARGCISAIQIMPTGTSTAPTMTVEGSASWTDGSKWNTTDAPLAGNVIIDATGDVTITVDGAQVALGGITVNGSGKVTFLTANGGSLSASAISTSGTLVLGAGVTIDTVPAEVTYEAKATSLVTSTYGEGTTYAGGAGTAESPVPFTFNANGKMTLTGSEPFYLDQTHGGVASTVNFVDAKLYALNDQPEAHGFGVGHQTYTFSGTTALTAAKFVLGQGGAGRTSVFTMGDTSKVTVQQSNNVNNNQASIMFGHWDSATTFTIKDSAVFSAPDTDVLVALTRNNHTIDVNGGVMNVKGFKLSTNASGTNVMNLNGGELKLGSTGITSYGTTTMTINVLGETIITTTADEVPVTQTIAGDGVIVKKGAGVLAIGTSRPTMDVQEGSVKLTATTQEQADGELVLKVAENATAASKEKVAIVDGTGTSIEVLSISDVDEETHTITITLKTNSIKADSRTSTWAGLSGTVVVANAGEDPITVTVDAAFPEGVTQLDVSGKVDIVVDDLAAYGSTILNITEGAIVTIKGPYPFSQIMGAGDLVFDPGEGKEMTVNTNNGQFTGPCAIASGVVKMAGNNRCLGQWNMNRLILVKSGATLDINGVTGGEQAQSYRVTLEEGANFVNTGANISDRKFIVTSGLTLQGDATISAVEGSVIGGACHYNYYQSPINLGEFTLTKTGKGAMYYTSPVITGTGTLNVSEGTFEMCCTYNGGQPNFNNGTLVIGSDAALNIPYYFQNPTHLTVKNLTMNGTMSIHVDGRLTVNGALSGSGTVKNVVLGTDATLKLDGKGALTLENALTLAEGDTLALDLTALDLTKTSSIPVIKVTDAANMPANETFTGIPEKWNLVKSSDGKSLKLSKPSFTISIR